MSRQAVKDSLAAVLPDHVTIYTAPPSALAAPCVVIKLKEATQNGPCQWLQVYELSVVGPGGDNEAQLTSLEDMLIIVADALSRDFKQAIGWAEPGTLTSGGQTYLASAVLVTVDLTAPVVDIGRKRHAS